MIVHDLYRLLRDAPYGTKVELEVRGTALYVTVAREGVGGTLEIHDSEVHFSEYAEGELTEFVNDCVKSVWAGKNHG